MFTLFHNPFYYSPNYWFQAPRYLRQQSLFERYLDALDQRFVSTLKDDASELLGLENKNITDKSEAPPSAQSSESEPASSTVPPATATITAPNAKPKSSDAAPSPVCLVPQCTRQYISQSRSRFNGRDYVEEHREKVTGADGETRIATRRRLGDRWYENEVHIDKDGKKTERETWHNVGDSDIEAFKHEWSEKYQSKAEIGCAAIRSAPSESAPEAPAGSAATHE
jgi:hypothetical protein